MNFRCFRYERTSSTENIRREKQKRRERETGNVLGSSWPWHEALTKSWELRVDSINGSSLLPRAAFNYQWNLTNSRTFCHILSFSKANYAGEITHMSWALLWYWSLPKKASSTLAQSNSSVLRVFFRRSIQTIRQKFQFIIGQALVVLTMIIWLISIKAPNGHAPNTRAGSLARRSHLSLNICFNFGAKHNTEWMEFRSALPDTYKSCASEMIKKPEINCQDPLTIRIFSHSTLTSGIR